jgi:hypothetical protein
VVRTIPMVYLIKKKNDVNWPPLATGTARQPRGQRAVAGEELAAPAESAAAGSGADKRRGRGEADAAG